MPQRLQEPHPMTSPSRLLATIFLALLFGLLWVHGSPARADEACWTQFFGKPDSVITDMAVDKDGIWVVGRMTEGDSSPVLWLALLDHKGRVKWQMRLPPKGYQLYPRLAPSLNGHWIVAEILRPSVPAPGGSLTSSQAWLGQVSKEGKLSKTMTIAPHRTNTIQAVSGLRDGGLLLAGMVETGTELRSKGWLARLDAKGQLVWQRVLPQVAWLVSLQGMDREQWLLAGQIPGKDESDQSPWLAIIDGQGRIQQSWQPEVQGLSLYAALATSDAWWLAGEWSPPLSGARLIRVERGNDKTREYPVQGFSILRLLTQHPHGLMAGGDGLGDASPDAPDNSPGWLTLPQFTIKDARIPEPQPAAQRLTRFPHGELRAWAWLFEPSTHRYPNYKLIGAGTDHAKGAWVGCLMTAPMPAEGISMPAYFSTSKRSTP